MGSALSTRCDGDEAWDIKVGHATSIRPAETAPSCSGIADSRRTGVTGLASHQRHISVQPGLGHLAAARRVTRLTASRRVQAWPWLYGLGIHETFASFLRPEG